MKFSKFVKLFIGIICLFVLGIILISQGRLAQKVDASSTDVNYLFLPITMKPHEAPKLTNMVYIPAGEFQMGCEEANPNEDCRSDELPLHPVYLDAYNIGKYELTNDEFVVFLNWKGNNNCNGHDCVDIYGSRIHFLNNVFVVDDGFGDYPAYKLSWYAADEYCKASGGRLPTEAEWEKAARGNNDTRMFPWGNQMPNCTYANFNQCLNTPTTVGSYPAGASPYGVIDLSGNVSEWVNDNYGNEYYYDSPYKNPTGPEHGDMWPVVFKVYRGGSSVYDWRGIRIPFRKNTLPDYNLSEIGFRCASSPGN